MKLTKKELEAFLNQINDKVKEQIVSKKKTLGIEVKENIINYNKKCSIEVTYDQDYISIVFKDAKLLSTNQIFQILQYRKFEIFPYKKMWQELVANALKDKPNLPVFKDNCELVLLRQSNRLVDNDSMGVMFKYIIDALRYDKKDPKPYVISDDNPNVVENIKFLQIKNAQHVLGIRIQRIKDNTLKSKTILDFAAKSSL